MLLDLFSVHAVHVLELASILMTERQPSGLISASILSLLPEVYPGPCWHRTATSLKSWSMQLPPKYNFLPNKYLSPTYHVPDTIIPSDEQNKYGTCLCVAYSQPDMNYCWGRRNFLLPF